MNKEYCVLKRLPRDGAHIMAFGYKTFCCKEDMDEKPNWHEVIFKLVLSEYKLKKEFPEDIEDSVLEYILHRETWNVLSGDPENKEHLIGVTKWKDLNNDNVKNECSELGHVFTWMPKDQSICIRCGYLLRGNDEAIRFI